MDWLLAAVNYQYVQVFKDSKKAANERAATFEADAKELAAQLSILDGALAGKAWVAGKDFTHRRRRAGSDHAPVPGFPDRAAGAEQPEGLAREAEGAAGVQESDGSVEMCMRYASATPHLVMVGLASRPSTSLMGHDAS